MNRTSENNLSMAIIEERNNVNSFCNATVSFDEVFLRPSLNSTYLNSDSSVLAPPNLVSPCDSDHESRQTFDCMKEELLSFSDFETTEWEEETLCNPTFVHLELPQKRGRCVSDDTSDDSGSEYYRNWKEYEEIHETDDDEGRNEDVNVSICSFDTQFISWALPKASDDLSRDIDWEDVDLLVSTILDCENRDDEGADYGNARNLKIDHGIDQRERENSSHLTSNPEWDEQSDDNSKQGKVYMEPTDKDVLLGRGGRTNNSPGNKRYLKEKASLQGMYMGTSRKAIKGQICNELIRRVHSWGGRFLQQEGKSDLWFEASPQRVRTKVSQALREMNTKEAREAKRARYADSRSSK